MDVDELFRRHVDDIFAYAARRVGRDAALEIAAETFRIAIESAAHFDPARGEPRPWLFGIASNLIRSHWRAERRHLAALERAARIASSQPDVAVDAAERLDAERQLAAVLAELAAVAPDDRDVLTLYAWEGLSYEAIADALDIPVGTVRSRLHRTRRAIRSNEGGTP